MLEKNKQEKKWGEQPGAESAAAEKPEQKGAAQEKEQSPEKTQEQFKEAEPDSTEEEASVTEKEGTPSEGQPSAASSSKKEREKQIERILERDLVDIYSELEPAKKKEFKQKGEATAHQINELLDKAKVQTKKIINLIKKWLAVLPGMNKFFIEQEAKSKADEIIKLKKK